MEAELPAVPWPIRIRKQAVLEALSSVRNECRRIWCESAQPAPPASTDHDAPPASFFHQAAHYAHIHRYELPSSDAHESMFMALARFWKDRDALIASLLVLGWWEEGCRPDWTVKRLRPQGERAVCQEQKRLLIERSKTARAATADVSTRGALTMDVDKLRGDFIDQAARRIQNWLKWCRELLANNSEQEPTPLGDSHSTVPIELVVDGISIGGAEAPSEGPRDEGLELNCGLATISFTPILNGKTQPTITATEVDLIVEREVKVYINGVEIPLPKLPRGTRIRFRGPQPARPRSARRIGEPFEWPTK